MRGLAVLVGAYAAASVAVLAVAGGVLADDLAAASPSDALLVHLAKLGKEGRLASLAFDILESTLERPDGTFYFAVLLNTFFVVLAMAALAIKAAFFGASSSTESQNVLQVSLSLRARASRPIAFADTALTLCSAA